LKVLRIKGPTLLGRLSANRVLEPRVGDTVQIFGGLRERYDVHDRMRCTDEAREAAAQYSSHI
jgi:ATP-dependent Clp protease ATP-binding subunit ClpA